MNRVFVDKYFCIYGSTEESHEKESLFGNSIMWGATPKTRGASSASPPFRNRYRSTKRHPLQTPSRFSCIMQLCTIILVIWIPAVSCVHLQHDNTELVLLEWIHTLPGGWVHDAQEIRKSRVGVRGNTGMIAKSSIAVGTPLIEVPASHVIRNSKPGGLLDCKLARLLAKELSLGSRSKFGPFVQHALHHASNHNIPSNWSDKGKELLQEIIGRLSIETEIPPIEPVEWLSDDWKGTCGGNLDDQIGVKAALLVIQWNHNGNIFPFAGLYNHRNGNWTNAEIVTSSTGKVVVQSTREISAGEEVLLSLNDCRECGRREPGYGTAEILRDSGVLESYPQRWHYFHRQIQFELDLIDHSDTIASFDIQWIKPPERVFQAQDIPRLEGRFRKMIRRLLRIVNIDYKDGNPGIPSSEWEMSLQFCQANIQAMELALLSIQTNYSQLVSISNQRLISSTVQSHYDPFLWEPDDIDYFAETCDSFEDEIDFIQHRDVEHTNSPFQNVHYYIHPDTRDVVLDLDHVVQIASVYRPQYHETMVHSAARFLDSVKRVLFVGGGDSMLLHEILKYPELELVVGLELDQLVVRKSFKYFHTQPHFDDPRVEWWFGDATKSLLLLWEEYWQSFDLVLVDLSETAMSFSVTKHLNVFDALALLLKPDGIMVKNEQYLNEFSDVFVHVMGMLIMCPVLCDQSFIMGSNGIDFVHASMKDHGVETMLYDTRITNISRMKDVHDYRHNKANQLDKCGTISDDGGIGDTRAGVLEVLEIELIEEYSKLNSSAIESAIRSAGFVPLDDLVSIGVQMLIPLAEGYVLVRSMGVPNHCSIDIHIWGSFHKLQRLSTAVIAAIGSTREVSRYRVVVGGMHGASTWEVDKTEIGPRVTTTRKCNQTTVWEDEAPGSLLHEQEILVESTILEMLSSMSFASEGAAVLVCGKAKEDCSIARRLLGSLPQRLVEVSTCASLEPAGNLSAMFDCEITTQQRLIKSLEGIKGAVWIVDHSVSFEMMQIVHSVLSRDEVRNKIVHPRSLFLLWSMHPMTEPWRRLFLDRYRRIQELDPVSLAEYDVLTSSSGGEELLAMQLGMLSLGNPEAAHEFVAAEKNLREHLGTDLHNIQVTLQNITGGNFAPWDPYNPKEFLQSDYDETPALEQYFSQRPLGYHILVHLESKDEYELKLNGGFLEARVQTAMAHMSFDCSDTRRYENVGKGLLVVCLHPKSGSLVLTWDGKTRVDVSYTRVGTKQPIDWKHGFIGFIEGVLDHRLKVMSQQEMPRGSGRVVNLPGDISSRKDYDLFWERLHLAPERGLPVWDASETDTRSYLQEL
eukprot:Nitzschia sp. Nitz4//scaffold164_size50480//28561//32565//NITZ4_007005-RA/size50480-augustus-gene-0.47-mRNA-1//1//CDS//3329538083//5648//frame0